jgi:hypothetical protein
VEGSKTLFCSSKSPKTQERISLKFIENLGTRPQKGLSALTVSQHHSTRSKPQRVTCILIKTDEYGLQHSNELDSSD